MDDITAGLEIRAIRLSTLLFVEYLYLRGTWVIVARERQNVYNVTMCHVQFCDVYE